MAKKINNVGKQLVPVSKPPWLVDELIAEQLGYGSWRLQACLVEMIDRARYAHHFEKPFPEMPRHDMADVDSCTTSSGADLALTGYEQAGER